MTTINSELPSRVAVSLKPVNIPPPQSEILPGTRQKSPPEEAIKGEEKKTAKEVSSEKQLEDVVKQLNEFVKEHDRTLNFSVDRSLQRTVVRVVNSETGETIRQIPSEEMLSMARNIGSEMSALIDVLA